MTQSPQAGPRATQLSQSTCITSVIASSIVWFSGPLIEPWSHVPPGLTEITRAPLPTFRGRHRRGNRKCQRSRLASRPWPHTSAQATFDDLGTHLSQVTFCVVDLETTGGAETDMITEFGAVKVCGGEVLGEFQTLVNPRTHIPPLIAVLTGITNQMVAPAPRLAEVLPSFLEFAHGTVIVAHNAPFDVGFLRRACASLNYPFPRWPVLDTAALARQILLRDEVRNCKLATLAQHFRAAVTPNHRALTDAQATVDVLHALIERVGNLGVHTIEDLQEFSRRVSPQRRAKRTWASDLPDQPGIYLFVAEHDQTRHVLYVGQVQEHPDPGSDLLHRSRETTTDGRDGPTGDRGGVGALRDPAAGRCHRAAADRQSRPPLQPTLQVSRPGPVDQDHPGGLPPAVDGPPGQDDGATYFGPFHRRQAAEDVVLAIYDSFPIRQCTPRLSPRVPSSACALAGMGRCSSPCDGTITQAAYAEIVEQVRQALARDVRPAVSGVQERLIRLVEQQRFEEAATIRRRLETLARTGARFHRVRSLAACPEIVAAHREGANWDIHVIRYGRLAAAGVATPREVPQAVARAVQATAETVLPPPGPLPAAGIEETEQIAGWLERPGVRLIEITGDWMWPLHAVLDHESFVHHALGDLGRSEPSPAAGARA